MNATEAMAEASSFHFELLAKIEAESDTVGAGIPLSLVGDFQSPDRLKGTLRISLGFFDFQMDTITIGDTTYITDPQTGQWQKAPGQGAGLPNPADLTAIQGEALETLELVGLEMLDGVSVYHLSGEPPREVLSPADGEEVHADFWIGLEDSLFRKIEAGGTVSLTGDNGLLGGPVAGGIDADTATLTLTMTFSDYGKPVVIEPPELP